MIQLVLTEEQQRLISEATEPVEIIGPSGRVLATVLHGYTEAELRQVAEEARNFTPVGTLRELLDRLKSSQPVA